MSEAATAVLVRHFPGLPSTRARELSARIDFAEDLRETATPPDPRNATRLRDLRRFKRCLREMHRLLGASYPDLMSANHHAVEVEIRLANSAYMMTTFGPPDHVFIKTLVGVYRDAAGEAPPSFVVDRENGHIVRNRFTDFVLDAFRALCDGEPPSLDTVRRAVDDLRMAAKS